MLLTPDNSMWKLFLPNDIPLLMVKTVIKNNTHVLLLRVSLQLGIM